MFLKALVLFTLFLTYAHSEKAKKNYTTLEPEWDVKDFVPKRYSLQQMNKHLIVGYFPSWSEGSAQDDQPTAMRITPGYVNTLLIAFARSNLRYKKGSYDISETGITTPYDGEGLLNSVKWLKKRNITVILSLGGQTYWQHAIHSDNPPSWDIDYQQIKDLLDDMYIDGIDWDYEPGSEMYPLAEPKHINKFIDFIVKSRQMMPKDLNYLIAAAPSGVGAFGGQINDDPQSPYSFSYGQSIGNVFGRADFIGAPSATLWGFKTTGHFIPVMKECGEMLDIIVYQGYNCGGATDRTVMYDSFAYYAKTYGFAVVAGVHVHDEPWGPYYIFSNDLIADLSLHILNGGRHADSRPYDGIMLWDLLSKAEKLSKDNNAYRFCMVAHVILMEKGTKEQALKAADDLIPPTAAPSVWKPKVIPWGPEVCGAPTWVHRDLGEVGFKVYWQGFVWELVYWAGASDMPANGVSNWKKSSVCTEDGIVPQIKLYCGKYVQYIENQVYGKGGLYAVYQGALYKTKWYAGAADSPNKGGPWEQVNDASCNPADPSQLQVQSTIGMDPEFLKKNIQFTFVDPNTNPSPSSDSSSSATTKAPTTKAPTTKAPTTIAPTTKAPTTKAPMEETTKAPETRPSHNSGPETKPSSKKDPIYSVVPEIVTNPSLPGKRINNAQTCFVDEWGQGMYKQGSQVFYKGYIWEAVWMHENIVPVYGESNNAWKRLRICGESAESNAMVFYLYCGEKQWEKRPYGGSGKRVYHKGAIYRNNYWTTDEPEDKQWGSWARVQACDPQQPGNKIALTAKNMTGEELKMFAAAGETEVDSASKSGSIVPIVIPVLVVLALILAAAGFYYQRQKKNKDVLANLQNFESEMGKFNKPLAQ